MVVVVNTNQDDAATGMTESDDGSNDFFVDFVAIEFLLMFKVLRRGLLQQSPVVAIVFGRRIDGRLLFKPVRLTPLRRPKKFCDGIAVLLVDVDDPPGELEPV